MEDTQEDRLAVHCFYVCSSPSGSALLGDLLGVSRSVQALFAPQYFCSSLSLPRMKVPGNFGSRERMFP